MRISFTTKGSFKNMERFLQTNRNLNIRRLVEPYAQQGVDALARATPVDSGIAADSWGYRIDVKRDVVTITWTNRDTENGFPVAVMLQYGHGTGTGGYVHGRDYINPAVRPIFDSIANGVWKVVTSA